MTWVPRPLWGSLFRSERAHLRVTAHALLLCPLVLLPCLVGRHFQVRHLVFLALSPYHLCVILADSLQTSPQICGCMTFQPTLGPSQHNSQMATLLIPRQHIVLRTASALQ